MSFPFLLLLLLPLKSQHVAAVQGLSRHIRIPEFLKISPPSPNLTLFEPFTPFIIFKDFSR